MSLNLRIECLPEPVLLFGGNATGVEPRRIMGKYGAADKVAAPNELRIGIVGPAADVQFARNWLPAVERSCDSAREEREAVSGLAWCAAGLRRNVCGRRSVHSPAGR